MDQYLPSRVGPWAKFHLAPLVVKGEPGDIYFAGGLEDARWYIEAGAVGRNHHFGLVGAIETLIRAGQVGDGRFGVSFGW